MNYSLQVRTEPLKSLYKSSRRRGKHITSEQSGQKDGQEEKWLGETTRETIFIKGRVAITLYGMYEL
jgi:hypothetical protein